VLRQLVRGLKPDLPAAVFVVVHLEPNSTSHLPEILSRAGPLQAVHPRDGAPIVPGRIYVAPPDRHLLIANGRLRVVRGPRENRFRPAIDPLFRTAAVAYGPRVIGVVLSGALDDGAAGLLEIKQSGGLALVQDPADALIPSMPRTACETVEVDHALPAARLAAKLVELVSEPLPELGEPTVPEDLQKEVLGELNPARAGQAGQPGTPSVYSCPECGGVLRELRERDLFRFRCRVGHAYSANTLLQEQSNTIEDALWIALRALEEREELARKLESQTRDRGLHLASTRYTELAEEMSRRAEVLRRVLPLGDGAADSGFVESRSAEG
jgi:two-component system chemotaxis response regulator CheB